MSRFILGRQTSPKYLRQELLKEFSANRFSLNHYEFVDFTVFEYGQRTQYLQWRVFSFMIVTLLTGHVYFSKAEELPAATPFSGLIYMHIWLFALVVSHAFLEVIALVWTFYTIPSPILVRIHQTPWYFKFLWLLYNTLYPNIMSCNMAYYLAVSSMETHIGESRFFLALLSSFAGIHVSVTATPSRLAHVVQPLLFNLLHFAFSFIYQAYGLTDSFGKNYVYLEIDWFQSRSSAMCRALIWLVATCFCHLLMVWCSWFRRLVYRGTRERTARPIYGFSPEEYYPFNEEADHMDYFEMPFRDETAVTDALIEAPAAKIQMMYSPHLSYRELNAHRAPMRKTSPGENLWAARQLSVPAFRNRQIVRGRGFPARIRTKKTGTKFCSKDCCDRSIQQKVRNNQGAPRKNYSQGNRSARTCQDNLLAKNQIHKRNKSSECKGQIRERDKSSRCKDQIQNRDKSSRCKDQIQKGDTSSRCRSRCKHKRKSNTGPASIAWVGTVRKGERSVDSQMISLQAGEHKSKQLAVGERRQDAAPVKCLSDEENDSLSSMVTEQADDSFIHR